MKPIGKALLELRSVLFGIGMFNSLVDSFVVLLAGVLAAILLTLSWYWALIPFAIYFIWHTRTLLKSAGYTNVEEQVPQLREALRTAADSVNQDNEVVRGLHTEVIDKMRLIKTSAFLHFGSMTKQLVTIAILCFIIIAVSALNIHFLDATYLLSEIGVSSGNLLSGGAGIFGKLSNKDSKNAVLVKEVTLIDESDLYGNATVIEMGTEELNLELNPDGSGIKMGDVRDAEKREFSEHDPNEIQASTDTAFTEDIPKEYQGIVRNYFKSMK